MSDLCLLVSYTLLLILGIWINSIPYNDTLILWDWTYIHFHHELWPNSLSDNLHKTQYMNTRTHSSILLVLLVTKNFSLTFWGVYFYCFSGINGTGDRYTGSFNMTNRVFTSVSLCTVTLSLLHKCLIDCYIRVYWGQVTVLLEYI